MRLGDYIDDYCSHCKRVLDHSVVSVEGEKAKKVRCRTCDYEHTYRGGKGGKKEMTKQEAFNAVLASVMGQQAGMPSGGSPGKKKK